MGGGIDVSSNLVDGSANGIVLIDHSGHPIATKGVSVHDNDIYLRGAGMAGAADPSTENSIFTAASNNHFESNHYYVTSYVNQLKWWWGPNATGGSLNGNTWSQWQTFGHDHPTGTVASI